jgi:hypothetical protein
MTDGMSAQLANICLDAATVRVASKLLPFQLATRTVAVRLLPR